jgi:hypothetical protein
LLLVLRRTVNYRLGQIYRVLSGLLVLSQPAAT